MKIVLDMNIPEVWEDFLRGAGHEAIHWSRIGDIRADDDAIMAWAREHDHVLVQRLPNSLLPSARLSPRLGHARVGKYGQVL